MSRHQKKHKPALEVKVSFEASRIASFVFSQCIRTNPPTGLLLQISQQGKD